ERRFRLHLFDCPRHPSLVDLGEVAPVLGGNRATFPRSTREGAAAACRVPVRAARCGQDGRVTDVWTRPLLRRDDLTPGSLAPWLAAALAAAWSLVAGLALAGLPALAVWMGEGATAPVGDPLGIGAAVWLAAHRVPLDVD